MHTSLGDLRQLDGSRLVKGGDVGQLKEPPIQKHLVVRKKSRDTGVLTDDLGSQRSEDRRTETNIPTDQLLATTDDKRYISHNSLVERRISQLETPAPPIPPPPHKNVIFCFIFDNVFSRAGPFFQETCFQLSLNNTEAQ